MTLYTYFDAGGTSGSGCPAVAATSSNNGIA